MNIIDLATKTMQTAIKSVVDATKIKVDAIDTRTTTINTNVNTANNSLNTLLAGRVVKSVQKGIYTGTSGDNSPTRSIILSTVSPDKCLVLLQGTTNNAGSSPTFISLVSTSNSATLVIGAGQNVILSGYSISWQVIEFY